MLNLIHTRPSLQLVWVSAIIFLLSVMIWIGLLWMNTNVSHHAEPITTAIPISTIDKLILQLNQAHQQCADLTNQFVQIGRKLSNENRITQLTIANNKTELQGEAQDIKAILNYIKKFPQHRLQRIRYENPYWQFVVKMDTKNG